MANPNKAKGTRAETAVVRFLQAHGIKAQRKALTGSKDCGDVDVLDAPRLASPVVLEVKTGQQTANPTRFQISKWMQQARAEGKNSGSPCYLCIVRYRRSICDAEIYIEHIDGGEVIREHLYLDEFCKLLT